MSAPEDESAPDSIRGLSVDAAVDVVVEGGAGRDPEQVRADLETVAEGGVVTEDGIESALAHVSKVVSTPATRVELAEMGLSDATEMASDLTEVDAVAWRLNAFESRLKALDSDVSELDSTLQTLVERADDPDATYEVARGIRRLAAEANAVQAAANELASDVEDFEQWLSASDARYDELDEDLDALEVALDEVANALDGLSNAADPSATWFTLRLRHTVLDLFFDDLQAELDDVRTLDGRQDESGDRADDVETRLDSLRNRWADVDAQLDELARPDWRDQFDDRLTALATELERFDPPIDWNDVEDTLAEYRTEAAAN